MRQMQIIIRVVAQHVGLTIATLKGPSRVPSIVRARRIAMHLCRVRAHASYPEIAKALGGMDHTSVRTGHQFVDGAMGSDRRLFEQVMALHELLDKIPRKCRDVVDICPRCRAELAAVDPFVTQLVEAGVRDA